MFRNTDEWVNAYKKRMHLRFTMEECPLCMAGSKALYSKDNWAELNSTQRSEE